MRCRREPRHFLEAEVFLFWYLISSATTFNHLQLRFLRLALDFLIEKITASWLHDLPTAHFRCHAVLGSAVAWVVQQNVRRRWNLREDNDSLL